MTTPITVSNRVSISASDNKEYTRAQNSKIGDQEIKQYITNEHTNIFNVIRAKDGDETTLSRSDLELISKDSATLNAFGYTVEHNGDVYVLKSANGKTLTFDFETLAEKAKRHWDAFKTERAEKQEAKKLEKAAKKAEKFNKKYNGQATVEVVGNKYKLTVNEGAKLTVSNIMDLVSNMDKFIDDNGENFLGTGIESVHTGRDSVANDSEALNTVLRPGVYSINME